MTPDTIVIIVGDALVVLIICVRFMLVAAVIACIGQEAFHMAVGTRAVSAFVINRKSVGQVIVSR